MNTFSRLEYKHDLRSTINTQVAIQKLPYSHQVDWSKHCAQHQIEFSSLEQFAKWLPLTAQTFKNFEPFSRNKLGKNYSTHNRGTILLDMIQITSKEHQDMCPRKTRVPQCGQLRNLTKNIVNTKASSRVPEAATIRRPKRSSNQQSFKVSVRGRQPQNIHVQKIQKHVR